MNDQRGFQTETCCKSQNLWCWIVKSRYRKSNREIKIRNARVRKDTGVLAVVIIWILGSRSRRIILGERAGLEIKRAKTEALRK